MTWLTFSAAEITALVRKTLDLHIVAPMVETPDGTMGNLQAGSSGGVRIEGVESGDAVPVTGSVTATVASTTVTALGDGTTTPVAVESAGADTASNTNKALSVSARLSALNGAGTPSWDRVRAGIIAIGSVFTGYLNTIPTSIYNAAPTTRTEGQGGPIQAASDGSLMVRSAAFDAVSGADGVIPKYSDADRNFPWDHGASAVADGVTTPGYINMVGFRELTISFNTITVTAGETCTLTILACDRNDGTEPSAIAAGEWIDISATVLGAASWTSANTVQYKTSHTWIKTQVITAGGHANSSWVLMGEKLW